MDINMFKTVTICIGETEIDHIINLLVLVKQTKLALPPT